MRETHFVSRLELSSDSVTQSCVPLTQYIDMHNKLVADVVPVSIIVRKLKLESIKKIVVP